ncbi:uncharacterized protein DDB_G0287625-like [Hyalella azteca]|uniref:Uncharacterized protein DDB_G0287625-like n=1 Tax=Hyalella azteca TaxID=294128 RepID=A0A8B7N505_HYAAZ|nr:uncharacterized protein DDB_G0287625-like [Hyalella azteca]
MSNSSKFGFTHIFAALFFHIICSHSAEAQISLHRSIDRNYDSSLQQRVSRRLLSSSIVTPISPELEHDPMAATVLGGINRIGRSTVQAAELLSLTTDVQQKRHLVNQGGNVVLNQNEQPLVLNSQVNTIDQNSPFSHISPHNFHNDNQNKQVNFITTQSVPSGNHNRVNNLNHNTVLNSNQIRPINVVHQQTFLDTNSQNSQSNVINQQSNTISNPNKQLQIVRTITTPASNRQTITTVTSNNNNQALLTSTTNNQNNIQNQLPLILNQFQSNNNGFNNANARNNIQHNKVSVIQSGSVVQQHNPIINNENGNNDGKPSFVQQQFSAVNPHDGNNRDNNNKNDRKESDNRQLFLANSSSNSKSPSTAVTSGPCVAAFSVRKGIAQDTDKSKPRRLTFQDVLTNTGGWSKKRQQFETPCTGLYFFSFHAISAKDSDFTIALMKDGHFQVTAYGGKDGYQWGANSVLLFLNPGENVYLELQQGEIYEHPYEEAYTTFSGFLINSL